MKPSLWRLIYHVSLVVIMLYFLLVVFEIDGWLETSSIIGFTAFIILHVLHLKFWRCPNCKKFLMIKFFAPLDHCPSCCEDISE